MAPDPRTAIAPAAVQAYFDGRQPDSPDCRVAASQVRCTWTDPQSATRRLQVTFWASPQNAVSAIAGEGAQPLEIELTERAAAVEDGGAIVVWAVVGGRGVQVSNAGGTGGDGPANLARLVALASAAARGMATP